MAPFRPCPPVRRPAAFLVVPIAAGLSPRRRTRSAALRIQVRRGGPDAQVKFRTTRPGEAFLDMSVAARRVSWAEPGHESAVVSLFVDGHYATDVVISSNRPTPREFALGSLSAGVHTLRIHYAAHRSRSRAGAASLRHLHVHTVSKNNPEYAAARYAPVLYGRNVPSWAGRSRAPSRTPRWWPGTRSPRRRARSLGDRVLRRLEQRGRRHRHPGVDGPLGPQHRHRVGLSRRGQPGRPPRPRVGRLPGGRPPDPARSGAGTTATHPLLETCTSNNNMCDRWTTRCASRSRRARSGPSSSPAST